MYVLFGMYPLLIIFFCKTLLILLDSLVFFGICRISLVPCTSFLCQSQHPLSSRGVYSEIAIDFLDDLEVSEIANLLQNN